MGAIIYLLAGNGQGGVKIIIQDHLLESGASGGVQALADQEWTGFLEHIDCLDCGCQPWNIQPGVFRAGRAAQTFHQLLKVCRGGAATPTHHGNMILLHKFRQ